MAAVAVTLMAASPAVAQSVHKSVTATGTGHARVHPKNRHRNSSIVAAVRAAQKVAIKRAVRNAHKNALLYAQAIGLTLGSAISISDQQSNGFYVSTGPGGSGPFGPNRYCGKIRRVVGKVVPGTKPTYKTVHRCIVPRFAYTSLVVAYSAN
jgi:uncharacterized protein YggE